MSAKLNYSDLELKSDLQRFYKENNKIPVAQDMKVNKGYISYYHYIKRYGSFSTALEIAGFSPNRYRCTDEELITMIQNLAKELGHSPTVEYVNQLENFPCSITFDNHFGNWNKMLAIAGLPINKLNEQLTGEEVCELCGGKTWNNQWSIRNGKRVCNKCNGTKGCERTYVNGTLDPTCTTAIGVITEYVVLNVLKDTINCNTLDNFHAKVDLVSKQYGEIDVKSMTLSQYNNWIFTPNIEYHPDNYICLGFNKDKTKILHVWIIPKKSNIVTRTGISITNSEQALLKAQQYEVDPEPYNTVYQNLDIYTLPEFCNLPRGEM